MTAIWVNNGLNRIAQQYLGGGAALAITVKLFVNNHTPAVVDTTSNYTVCTLSGYSDAALTTGSWVISTTGGVMTATYPSFTFNFNSYGGGTTIYGYIFVDTTSSTLLAAELFGTSYAVPSGGGSLTLALTETDQN